MATKFKSAEPGGRRGSLDKMQEAIKEANAEMIKTMEGRLKAQDERFVALLDKKFKVQGEEIREVVKDMQAEFRAEMVESNKKIREDVAQLAQAFSGKIVEVNKKVEGLLESDQQVVKKVEEFEEKISRNEGQILVLQYKAMEKALRIRGLREEKQQDLVKILSEALAELLHCEPEEVAFGVEKMYRVNSWIARQKNLPRDVVIYFSSKKLRDNILQASYQQRVPVGEQEVAILKEIPPKMLRERKEYKFLTDELNKRQIRYRWEVPYGLSVLYDGKNYRLESVRKAREFFSRVLQQEIAGPATEEMEKEQTAEQQLQMSLYQYAQEQRMMTRAGARKKEKEEKGKEKEQQIQQQTTQVYSSEAVGGAGSKDMEEDLLDLTQRLFGASDGN